VEIKMLTSNEGKWIKRIWGENISRPTHCEKGFSWIQQQTAKTNKTRNRKRNENLD
jgi:hypothetical protein